MHNSRIKHIVLVIAIAFSSCKKSKTVDYKYADSPKVLSCNLSNGDLFHDAIYAFNNDLINTYDKQKSNGSRIYSNFVNFSSRGKINVEDIASKHSLKIAKALKAESNLWHIENGKTSLNASHPLVDCIANNIKDKDIKATFNALLSTNSLKPKLILPLLNASPGAVQTDWNLKSYIAFELFYSQLLEVELAQLKNPNPKPDVKPAQPLIKNVNFNQRPAK